MNDHDQIHLQQARAFDRNALTAIYDDYHHPIYRYIYRQVGEVDIARDLTSAVFHRFLRAVKNGSGPKKNLNAWLYRAAYNMVIDHYRRQQHRQHASLSEELVALDGDPVSLAEQRILANKVRSTLQHLTPAQQQVITLKFLEGLSNREVAVILDKPVGAVKSFVWPYIGQELIVQVSGASFYEWTPAGRVPITFADVAIGDTVSIHGTVAGDIFTANRVMTGVQCY